MAGDNGAIMTGNPTIRSLIESDLGYCCVWFFFTHYRSTSLIAARLGMSRRSVQEWKARVRSGEEKCKGCPNCLHARITLAGEPRKRA